MYANAWTLKRSLALLFPFQVDDPKVLPHYPYRDDSLLLHQAVKKYVTEVLTLFYGNVDSG